MRPPVETLLKQVPAVKPRTAAPKPTDKGTAAVRAAVQYVMEVKQPALLRFDQDTPPPRSGYIDVLVADHIRGRNVLALTRDRHTAL